MVGLPGQAGYDPDAGPHPRLTKGLTILMVSHDINEIVHFCDKALLLNTQAVAYGRPADILNRENLGLIYGDRVFVYQHRGHPHVIIGDFDA